MNKKRKISFIGLLGLLLTCFCVLSGFLFSKTEDYFLDNIANNINDVVEHYNTSDFIPSEIDITKNAQTTRNDKRYPDLYAKYYYTSLVKYIFQKSSEDCFDSFDNNINFYTQDTFSVSTSKDSSGFYAIDGNLFKVYFSEEVLPSRGYLNARNGCDSFAFISEDYANYLLTKYDLGSYEELILDQNASTLSFLGNDEIIHKLSINNVISSGYKNGPVAKSKNPYFALVFLNNGLLNALNVTFEIGMKESPYCIRDVLSTIKTLGYSNTDYSFSIRTPNYRTLDLEIKTNLSDAFVRYLDMENDAFLYSAWVVSFFAVVFSFFVLWIGMRVDKRTLFYFIGIFSIVFLIANIISSFVVTYFMFYICSTMVETIFLLFLLEVIIQKNQKKKTPAKPTLDKELIYEIKI